MRTDCGKGCPCPDDFEDHLLSINKAELDEIISNCEIHNDEAISMDLLNQGLQSQEED